MCRKRSVGINSEAKMEDDERQYANRKCRVYVAIG